MEKFGNGHDLVSAEIQRARTGAPTLEELLNLREIASIHSHTLASQVERIIRSFFEPQRIGHQNRRKIRMR